MKTLIRVPATTANLGPGFDTLGLALSLWNELEISCASEEDGITISVEGFGSESLPNNHHNLIVRAAHYIYTVTGSAVPGRQFHARNLFPTSSGLGSSSAAIIMGFLAANQALDQPLETSALLNLAAEFEGHPDNVTPALLGGLTMSALINDGVLARKVEPDKGWWIGVVVPQVSISTKSMRQALRREVSLGDAVFNISRVPLIVEALRSGDLELMRIAIDDRLHQPQRLPLIPGASEAISEAETCGAAAALSGAGPGIVAFARSEETANTAIVKMARAFNQKGLVSWSWVGKVDLIGAQVKNIE